MTFKTLKNFDLSGKTVLLRADLNVPVKDGQVRETTRIDRLTQTIDYLVEHDAKIVVLSHFGRPKGEVVAKLSLEFLPPFLKESWGHDVSFSNEAIGAPAQKVIDNLDNGEILLLENLRFYAGEEQNDASFAKQLASLGDIFINDAFSAAHRAHASTEGITHHLPSGAGFAMEAELNALSSALGKPKRPVIAIVGGAKISTKLALLGNLIERVDYLVLGGGMPNTFLYADGVEVGKSICEKDMVEQARTIMKKAKDQNCEIILPVDRVVVEEFAEGAPNEVCDVESIPLHKEALDIGPATISKVVEILQDCKTVLWNGPLGVFELKPFNEGTDKIAQEVARLTQDGKVISVAGGGDTVAALEKAGVLEEFSYISTAGGAFLEWLEGKTLPGVAALQNLKNAA